MYIHCINISHFCQDISYEIQGTSDIGLILEVEDGKEITFFDIIREVKNCEGFNISIKVTDPTVSKNG